MRLWSIHPKYLDQKALVALWREGLLAKKVLEGKTKGYKNHPQLERFRKSDCPVSAINSYLWFVYDESKKKGYNFKREKLSKKQDCEGLVVNRGQLVFEIEHLRKKLLGRDREKYDKIRDLKALEVNPVFFVKEGGIENWEKINKPQ